jgi:hypothetical protein
MAGMVPGYIDIQRAKVLAEIIWPGYEVELDREAMLCNVRCQQNDATKKFTISFDPIRRTNDWVSIIKTMARHGFTAVITKEVNNKVGGSVAFRWISAASLDMYTITHTDNYCMGRAVLDAANEAISRSPIKKEVKK